jgi:hypothetical protein
VQRLNTGVQRKLDQIRQSGRIVHAPLLRFPFTPPLDSPAARLAMRIQAEGYDTVIVLPLASPYAGPVHDDVVSQLGEVSDETVLFCQHLEEIAIESDDCVRWRVQRESDGPKRALTVWNGDSDPLKWSVYWQEGQIPNRFLDDSQMKLSFRVAIAVPEHLDQARRQRLCVFFPTDNQLPMRMVAHATLETDESRKRIIPNTPNRLRIA